jgi:hypothetical protein
MAELKTKQTEANVEDFINSYADTELKKKDSFELLKLMKNETGLQPKMWGTSIIGFGQYHYKSEKSRQEGDWFLVGFSPRKTAISLYVYSGYLGFSEQDEMLKNLGKFKMGKGCIYVKKLEDINLNTLKKMINSTIKFLETKYEKH